MNGKLYCGYRVDSIEAYLKEGTRSFTYQLFDRLGTYDLIKFIQVSQIYKEVKETKLWKILNE